jgi:hypothetical protein
MRVGTLAHLVQNQVGRSWSFRRRCKVLKILVGERGFEPPTPWSRTRNRFANLLSRLGWLCVVLPLVRGFSAANGPKLDPKFLRHMKEAVC